MVGRRASWSGLMVTATALAAALIGAGPAAADVTVTPDQAVQGDPARLTFRVTEDRPGAHTTQIELGLPEAAPVAETWPMSDPDWAPRITMRTLDQPLPGLHHGSTSEVVSAITWIRATPPGDSPEAAELSISLGPMPQSERMVFTVVQTYSDGFEARWDQEPAADGARPERAAAIVTLQPAAAPPAPGGGVPDPAGASTDQDAATDDGGLGMLDVGLAAALLIALGLAGWFLFRDRRGVPDLPTEPTPTDPADATATTPAADEAADQEAVDRQAADREPVTVPATAATREQPAEEGTASGAR